VPKQAQGVVVGLNTEYHEIGYQDIQWAWYVASGIARVIEQGTVRLVFGPVTILNELRVDVVGSAAQYYVDDVLVYQTTNGSVGLLHLDAALYVAGDYVDSPVLEGLDVSDGSGRMLPVFGFGAENNAARGYGVLPAVIGAGGIALAADGVSPIRSAGVGRLLPAIGVGSDYAYSFGEGILLPVTGYASADELAPEFSIGDGALFPVIGYGSGYTVEGGRGEALLPASAEVSSLAYLHQHPKTHTRPVRVSYARWSRSVKRVSGTKPRPRSLALPNSGLPCSVRHSLSSQPTGLSLPSCGLAAGH